MRQVSVAVPVPGLGPLWTTLPDILLDPPVGARVLVPLGKRVLTGIVCGVEIDGAAVPSGRRLRRSEARCRRARPRAVPAGRDRASGTLGVRVLRLRPRRRPRHRHASSGVGAERAARADHGSRRGALAPGARCPARCSGRADGRAHHVRLDPERPLTRRERRRHLARAGWTDHACAAVAREG